MTRGLFLPRPSSEDTITLPRVKCLRESKYAIFVRREDDESGPKRFWVPQSVVTDDSEVWREGDLGKLVIKAWWARKEGIEP